MPPTVFEGAIRQRLRKRAALTGPTFGCEQEILNLGRLRVRGRPGENILDPHSP